MTVKLIIFDWDGTVSDSVARISTCIQLAAKDHDLPVPDFNAAKEIIGLGLQEAIAQLFPQAPTEMVAALVKLIRPITALRITSPVISFRVSWTRWNSCGSRITCWPSLQEKAARVWIAYFMRQVFKISFTVRAVPTKLAQSHTR